MRSRRRRAPYADVFARAVAELESQAGAGRDVDNKEADSTT